LRDDNGNVYDYKIENGNIYIYIPDNLAIPPKQVKLLHFDVLNEYTPVPIDTSTSTPISIVYAENRVASQSITDIINHSINVDVENKLITSQIDFANGTSDIKTYDFTNEVNQIKKILSIFPLDPVRNNRHLITYCKRHCSQEPNSGGT